MPSAFKLIAGGYIVARVILAVVRRFWPDFLRLEAVGVSSDPHLVAPLEARLARLDHLTHAELALLPENHEERGEVEGATAVFATMRTTLPDGGVEIAMTVVVESPPGPFTRRLHVAACGFRMDPDGVRHPLADEQLREIGMQANSSLLHQP